MRILVWLKIIRRIETSPDRSFVEKYWKRGWTIKWESDLKEATLHVKDMEYFTTDVVVEPQSNIKQMDEMVISKVHFKIAVTWK